VFDRSQLQTMETLHGGVRLDLNVGFQKYTAKNNASEGLDNMLRWILHNREQSVKPESLYQENTDFICFRGLLRLLLNTPYETRDPWIIRVMKWKGSIYLLQQETEQETQRKLNLTVRDRRFCYWGYKFEQYMTNQAELKSGEHPEVNENEEFCCMFRTKIGNISIMYGAEMDGYRSDSGAKTSHNSTDANRERPLVPNRFVEYKTSRQIDHDRQDRNFRRHKLVKWWAQSFLVGIEEIQCGWRDDNGIVSRVESISVAEIPKMAVDWRPNVCANFLLNFLTFLKETITSDSTKKVHRIHWSPGRGQGFSCELEEGGTGFLPDWYTKL